MSSLAAARADNFYYPPGWTPEQGSLNKYHGQHALRERARKLDQGILIIRFEMPFHVWCGGCQAMIAKGVRFNAEKKQIGNYYSTKIWSFKMKSACCQHEIEIHTDPKNCDYIVVSGAEKKTVEYDADDAGTTALPTDEEREKLQDPMYRVEHQGEDTRRASSTKPQLVLIKQAADAKHADPWRLNSRLRASLRSQKSRVSAEEQEARQKGLGIRLVPEEQEDREGAKRAVFHSRFERNLRDKRAAIRSASIFHPVPGEASLQDTHASGGVRHSIRRSSRSRGSGRQESSVVLRHSSAAESTAERMARLAAKRRRIDGQGVLALATGKSMAT